MSSQKTHQINLLCLSIILLFTILNVKAQTIICPIETDLGTLTCNQIGNPSATQIQEVPNFDEVRLPPYNMEITGILPQTALYVEDSDVISFCESAAREITRSITIYNDDNNNFTYDIGEAIEICTFTFNIEIDLEAPLFFAPEDFEVNCPSDLPYFFSEQEYIIADDNCPGYEVDYIDFSLEEFPTTETCPGDGLVIVRYWTTADLCGNRRDHTQTVTIQDVTGPEFTAPTNITVPCGTNLMDTLITGSATNGFDECEGVEVAVFSTIVESLTEENIPCLGATTYTKRWEAVDGCNNKTTKDQIIVVDCNDGGCSEIFDLALIKELTSTGPIIIGNNTPISFTITVVNQGDLAAQNIEIIDYIPAGLILNDVNWILAGANATSTIAGPLASGEITSIDISFTIDPNATIDTYTNYAEIFGAKDVNGNVAVDIDSTPDTSNENDFYEFQNGNEDDHDDASFALVENAPCATYNNAGSFCD